MDMTQSDALRTCPDCGGILEPSEPHWLSALQFDDVRAGERKPTRWRCLLCGYVERTEQPLRDPSRSSVADSA